MRPQHGWAIAERRVQIERIHHRARRMMRRNVQRAEIIPVILDIRAFLDREAHGAENRRDLLRRPADRVDRAGRLRARRLRNVDALGRQPASSAAASSTARRAASASVIAFFRTFSSAPRVLRARGSIAPSCFNSAVTAPFLPSNETRSSSSRSLSAAASSASRLRLYRLQIIGQHHIPSTHSGPRGDHLRRQKVKRADHACQADFTHGRCYKFSTRFK